MSLLDLVSHPRTIQLAISLSRFIPRGAAHRVAGWLANIIVRLGPERIRTLRTNVGQVLGLGCEEEADRVARRALGNFMRAYYDLFRAWNLPQEELRRRVHVPDWALDRIRSAGAAGQGIVLVFPHVGNFDLAGQLVSVYVPQLQALTLPNPPAGFQSLNEMRRRGGAEVTPLSPGALRRALRNLRQGGVVAMGGDRPVSELDKPFPFFGRPARVPSASVRLALKTGAAVVVLAAVWDSTRGAYALDFEPFLEMERTGSEEEDVARNMRRVLDALERVIRRWLEQWYMFVPVWPELVEG